MTEKNINEIDLMSVLLELLTKRKAMFIWVISFIVMGVAVALLSEEEYKASTMFVLSGNSRGANVGGELSGLASLAGINLNSDSQGDIPPKLYPEIVKSADFQLALLDVKINPKEFDKEMTYAEYFENHFKPAPLTVIKMYTLGLPRFILSKLVSNDSGGTASAYGGILKLTKVQKEHFKRISDQLAVEANDLGGFVKIEFRMPEPLMAAQMTEAAKSLLQKQVIEYRIKQAKMICEFTQERYKLKKDEHEKIQDQLARFRDENQRIMSSVYKNKLERIETEYSLSLSVYTELSKQLESAKLMVSKDIPTFTVLQSTIVPTERHRPRRALIVIVFTFLGGLFFVIFLFVKYFLVNLMAQLKENSKIKYN